MTYLNIAIWLLRGERNRNREKLVRVSARDREFQRASRIRLIDRVDFPRQMVLILVILIIAIDLFYDWRWNM